MIFVMAAIIVAWGIVAVIILCANHVAARADRLTNDTP